MNVHVNCYPKILSNESNSIVSWKVKERSCKAKILSLSFSLSLSLSLSLFLSLSLSLSLSLYQKMTGGPKSFLNNSASRQNYFCAVIQNPSVSTHAWMRGREDIWPWEVIEQIHNTSIRLLPSFSLWGNRTHFPPPLTLLSLLCHCSLGYLSLSFHVPHRLFVRTGILSLLHVSLLDFWTLYRSYPLV